MPDRPRASETKIADLLSDYADLLIAGRAPSPAKFCAPHPDVAFRLAPLLRLARALFNSRPTDSGISVSRGQQRVSGRVRSTRNVRKPKEQE